eukprot:9266802-Pyramimonas_sp.AAC.1
MAVSSRVMRLHFRLFSRSKHLGGQAGSKVLSNLVDMSSSVAVITLECSVRCRSGLQGTSATLAPASGQL